MTDQLLKYEDGSGELFYSALTIDVEDGINISMRDNFGIDMKPTSRVVDNVEIILEICASNNVKATFFILGEVAESFPGIIKRIGSEGHELGVHGYHHDQIFRLTSQKLKSELTRAKNLIESQTGQKISGFRAPAFSINEHTSWALRIIAECGFEYDSSIFPSVSPRYGWKGFSRNICRIRTNNSSSLIEVPLSVISYFGTNFPVCGGGYLRYFPYAFTRKAFATISSKRPVIVYLHPYELDTEKYPDYFYKARSEADLRHRLSLMFYRFQKSTVIDKLNFLTKKFRFRPLINIISNFEESGLIEDTEL